jgi:oxygen-independent coproporphyrinogen-3 oxidase
MTSHVNEVIIPDASLLRRFDGPGPRYTSYPNADRFVDAFNTDTFAAWLRSRAVLPARPLSLYVHIPFCNTICYYSLNPPVIPHDHRAPVPARDRELVVRRQKPLSVKACYRA